VGIGVGAPLGAAEDEAGSPGALTTPGDAVGDVDPRHPKPPAAKRLRSVKHDDEAKRRAKRRHREWG
jgi:hypothetical protein